MANWYGSCRSNYFKVLNLDAFTTFLEQFEAQLITSAKHPGLVGFYSTTEDGFAPYFFPDDADEPINLLDHLHEHLTPDTVAVVQEIGAEKMRYLTGWALAIDHTGVIARVDIEDIYQKATEARMGDCEITEAVY